jgi:hypothetical protein
MRKDYLTIKNTLSSWFPAPVRINFRISVDEPLIINYRMTLGSINYNSKKQEIVMNFPKDPQLDSRGLTMDFLKSHYPNVLNIWKVIKKDTELHLKYMADLWMKYIICEVNNIIFIMQKKYPSLVPNDNSNISENCYVRDNIIEGLYKEIEHIALTGNEIGLFQFNSSMGKIGNGFLFVKSCNEELLMQFVTLLKKASHNENVISKFRFAEIRKAEVESKVLDFKQELQNIIHKLEYS